MGDVCLAPPQQWKELVWSTPPPACSSAEKLLSLNTTRNISNFKKRKFSILKQCEFAYFKVREINVTRSKRAFKPVACFCDE